MLNIIKSPLLDQFNHIGHAFFTREGGVSVGDYSGLNCAESSKDNPFNVATNQALALSHLGFSMKQLASYQAQHGNTVVTATEAGKPYPLADAIVTTHTQLVLGADSADCPTVLLVDPINRVLGLVHAGWKSAFSGILENTVLKMHQQGAKISYIHAVIGPGIAQQSYQVSQSFYQQFCKASRENAAFFSPCEQPLHWRFDLKGFIRQRLEALRIHLIEDMDLDTYHQEALFYSCRRAFHRGQPDFGGHLACLYFKKVPERLKAD
ncbi:MAG: peptidoglycan editing factor PgeF [Candidatus Berkiella sp.]